MKEKAVKGQDPYFNKADPGARVGLQWIPNNAKVPPEEDFEPVIVQNILNGKLFTRPKGMTLLELQQWTRDNGGVEQWVPVESICHKTKEILKTPREVVVGDDGRKRKLPIAYDDRGRVSAVKKKKGSRIG